MTLFASVALVTCATEVAEPSATSCTAEPGVSASPVSEIALFEMFA